MSTEENPSGRKFYPIFLLIAIIITAASALAQSAKTKAAFVFPEPNAVSPLTESNTRQSHRTQPSYYEVIELSENFDYNNLKIEIYESDKKLNHCYVCYSISESSFIIDLTNFANGTYQVNVTNGKSTFLKTMTVFK